MDTQPVLIIGAGLVGLTLAQALNKRSIPYLIFERDPSVSYRGAGWGITLHWALTAFHNIVPDKVTERLGEAAVNPAAEASGELGHITYYDLQTGEARWKTPGSSSRRRLKREHLRTILLKDVNVQWSKTLSGFSKSANGTIQAVFEDQSMVAGSILVGCDGTNSTVRRLLLPSTYSTSRLPCRFMGITVVVASSIAQPIRNLDPYYLQGGDASQNVFLFFSFLDSPSNNTREDRDTYACQVMVGWPPKSPHPVEVPATSKECLLLMKRFAVGWAEPFKSFIASLPDEGGIEPMEIKVHDWEPPRRGPNMPLEDKARAWDNHDGSVTLAGDAAHPMTMFRGEAFNHGIKDVEILVDQIASLYTPSSSSTIHNGTLRSSITSQVERRRELIDFYEMQMCQRAHPAVLLSRQACIDAHDQKRINDDSPLVAKRGPTVGPDEHKA